MYVFIFLLAENEESHQDYAVGCIPVAGELLKYIYLMSCLSIIWLFSSNWNLMSPKSYNSSEKPGFLCKRVLNISCKWSKKWHVFGRQPTFDNNVVRGTSLKAKQSSVATVARYELVDLLFFNSLAFPLTIIPDDVMVISSRDPCPGLWGTDLSDDCEWQGTKKCHS